MLNGMEAAIGSARARIEADADSLAQRSAPIAPADDSGAGALSGFKDIVTKAIDEAEEKERVASAAMEAVDSGRSDDLVGAMLKGQEASMSFAMLVQMRNKVANALDELLKLSL